MHKISPQSRCRAAGLFTCLFGDDDEAVGADLVISHFEQLHRTIVDSVR